jgi:hypothetical protein
MVGGIVANNASGMCCGVAQNSYNTIKDVRLVLADGTVLDTANPDSCAAFLKVRQRCRGGVQSRMPSGSGATRSSKGRHTLVRTDAWHTCVRCPRLSHRARRSCVPP